jgi:hypothetical protein
MFCDMLFLISAHRSQLRLASVLYGGLFQSENIQIPKKAAMSDTENILGFSRPGDLVCNSVTVNNTEYTSGMLVVLAVSSQDGLTVGWIRKVIVRERKVFFYVIPRKCIRSEMRFFESTSVLSPPAVKCYTDLKSYKPLIPRGTEDYFVFFLAGKLIDDDEDTS